MSLYDVNPISSLSKPQSMAPAYRYGGPNAGASLQKGLSSTAERATGFKTAEIAENMGRPLSLSSQTRKGVFSFDGEPSGSNPFQSK
jgi:hypothetical protein